MKLTNTYQEPNRCQRRTIPYWNVDKESAGVQGVSVHVKSEKQPLLLWDSRCDFNINLYFARSSSVCWILHGLVSSTQVKFRSSEFISQESNSGTVMV